MLPGYSLEISDAITSHVPGTAVKLPTRNKYTPASRWARKKLHKYRATASVQRCRQWTTGTSAGSKSYICFFEWKVATMNTGWCWNALVRIQTDISDDAYAAAIWKEFQVMLRWADVRHYPSTALEELRMVKPQWDSNAYLRKWEQKTLCKCSIIQTTDNSASYRAT